MRQVKREYRSRRGREILRGALSSFEELGYEASTIEDIRRRCGASVGSIYHHFGSKAGIAAALYAEGLADYQVGLLGHMRRARSARSLVRGAVKHHLDWAEANPAWARYLLRMRRLDAVAAIEIQLRKMNADFLREAFGLVRPYMDKGQIAPLPPEVLVSLLLGPAQEFIRLWLSDRTALTLAQAKLLLTEAAWKSLAPASVGSSSSAQQV